MQEWVSQTPVFQGHGDQDPLVPISLGQLGAEFIQKFIPGHTLRIYEGLGHSCSDQVNIVPNS